MRSSRPARALLLAASLLARPASAHQVGISRGDYALDGDTVKVEVIFARRELASLLPAMDTDADGTVSEPELAASRAIVEAAFARAVRVEGDGSPCPAKMAAAALVEGDGASLEGECRCDGVPASLTVTFGLFAELGMGHRHLAHVVAGPRVKDDALMAKSPAISLQTGEAARKAGRSAGALAGLGVERALTGPFELLFLAGLLLAGPRARQLTAAALVFIAAEGASLAAAILWGRIPGASVTGPAVGLALVYIAIENFLVADAAHRYRTALPGGIVTGLALADSFAASPLPASGRAALAAAYAGGALLAHAGAAAVIVPCGAIAPGTLRRIGSVAAGLAGIAAILMALNRP